MKIAGIAVLQAPTDRVWAALNDPRVLVSTIPGCEQLEALGPDRYRMTITAGVASIKGTYLGDVELSDPLPPDSFTLRASGAGAPGTVNAEVKITLSSVDGSTTTVSYEADAVVGGAVGGVGQRVITAVAKRTATEFFAAVEAALAGAEAVAASGAGATELGTASNGTEPTASGSATTSSDHPTEAALPTTSEDADLARFVPTVFTRPAPAPTPVGGTVADQARAAAVGATIALLAVFIGWLLGRNSRP
jgi:hypothetical protein